MQLFCFLLKQFFENVKKDYGRGEGGGFREGQSGYSKHNFFFFRLVAVGYD